MITRDTKETETTTIQRHEVDKALITLTSRSLVESLDLNVIRLCSHAALTEVNGGLAAAAAAATAAAAAAAAVIVYQSSSQCHAPGASSRIARCIARRLHSSADKNGLHCNKCGTTSKAPPLAQISRG